MCYIRFDSLSYFTYKTVIQLSCGSANAIAMTSDGLIYGWGCNKMGQTGVGKDGGEIITTPLLLNSFSNIAIKSVHCVYCQSFALTTDGCVYSWGQLRLRKE